MPWEGRQRGVRTRAGARRLAYLLAGLQVAVAVFVVLADADHGLALELAYDDASS